jgi:NitT/TauT family transport system substrate-binding protein
LAAVLAVLVAACAPAPAAPPTSAPVAKPTEAPAKPAAAPAASPSASPAASPSAAASPAAPAALPSPSPVAAAAGGPLEVVKAIHVPSVLFAPLYVALDRGYFREQGVDLQLDRAAAGQDANVLLANGQLDVLVGGFSAATFAAISRGIDMRVVSSMGRQPAQGYPSALMVRTDLLQSGAVRGMADLKGRKVALNGRGVILDYHLAKLLATANLKPSDVEVVTMPWPEMVVALSTGALDAGLIGQPAAAQAVAKGVGRILSDDYNQNTQNAVLVANSRFLDQHRDAMADFLEVYVQSIRRLSDGKFKTDEQALAIIQKYTNTPPEVTRLAPDPYWPKDGHIKMDSLVDQQAYFMSSKSVDYTEPMDLHQLIDYGPLDAALKKTGG